MSRRAVASWLLVSCLIGGCSSAGGDDETARAITESLAAAAGSSGRVDITAAVAGDWTRLLFVCAYEDRASVEDRLGFAWPEYQPTDQDGENTWVFATDDEVVTWAMIAGYHADPCYYGQAQPPGTVAKGDAEFRVEDTGERVLDDVPYRALRPLK